MLAMKGLTAAAGGSIMSAYPVGWKLVLSNKARSVFMASEIKQPQAGHVGGLLISPWTSLVLALVAAAATWGAIQATHPVFRISEKYHAAMGDRPEVFEANRWAQDWVDREHAMMYVGELGLLLAGLIGTREGMLRRSWLTPLVAAPLGAIGGALGGFLGSLVYEYVRKNVGQAELLHTVAAQLLLGGPLGLGVGLGVGLSTRSASGTVKAAFGGLAAGALAAALYPVVVSIVLPAASTDALLPAERANRAVWLGLLAGLIGLLVPAASRQRKQSTAAMTASGEASS